jgi:hypothetical protein
MCNRLCKAADHIQVGVSTCTVYTGKSTEAVRHEREIQTQGGKNWILPKEINKNHSSETGNLEKTIISLYGWDRMEGAWL